MKMDIEKSWRKILKDEFEKNYFQVLYKTIHDEYLINTVHPPHKLIFNAFAHCPFETVKVVILGQDPYHGPGQAMGLSFSVPDNIQIPPSLKNIYKEIQNDVGIKIPTSGNLERWADQGVLLLNTTLTVRAGEAGSHSGLGWEKFTDAVIKQISDKKEHVVFLLWGNNARAKHPLIDVSKHLILEAPHPSPLAACRGFFGCKHFSQCNAYLRQHKRSPITW